MTKGLPFTLLWERSAGKSFRHPGLPAVFPKLSHLLLACYTPVAEGCDRPDSLAIQNRHIDKPLGGVEFPGSSIFPFPFSISF